MSVTVIHGDNIIDSRERFRSIIEVIKKRGWSIEYIEDEPSLEERLRQTDLFSEDVLFVLDNPSVNKLPKQKEISVNLLVWFKGVIGKRALDKFGIGVKVENFELPKIIFAFLDSPSLTTFDKLKSEPIEFIFALFARRIKDLYWVVVDPSTIPYPSWRVGKLENQARSFSEEDLKGMLGELARMDVKSKSSRLVLADSLDLFLAKYFV